MKPTPREETQVGLPSSNSPAEAPGAAGAIQRLRSRLAVMLLILLALQVFAPLQSAGFYSDDAWTSTMYADARNQGVGTWQYCYGQYQGMLRYQGRFAPAYNFLITPLLVTIGDDLPLYRAWCDVAHLLAFGAGIWLLLEMGVALPGAVVFGVFVLGCCQVTTYHDSFVSFGVVLQQVLFFGFIGLGCHARYAAGKPKAWLAGAVGSFALSVATSEFGLVFAAAHLVIAFRGFTAWRRLLLTLVPFVGVSVAYVLITVLSKAPGQYQGTSFGSAAPAVVSHAFLVQSFSVFPLLAQATAAVQPVWALAGVHDFFPAVAVVVTAALVLCLSWERLALSWPTAIRVGAVGLVLAFLPPVLTAVSRKYQMELVWGIFYLQAYLQFAGLGLIFLSLLGLVRSSRALVFRSVFAVGLCGYALLSLGVHRVWNRSVVEYLNAQWQVPRDNVTVALQTYCRNWSQGVDVAVDRNWLHRWENSAFLRAVVNLSGRYRTAEDIAKSGTLERPTIYVSYPVHSCGNDWVIVALCSRVSGGPSARTLEITPDSAVLYSFPTGAPVRDAVAYLRWRGGLVGAASDTELNGVPVARTQFNLQNIALH